jgi:P4 family phage/plasmid primase-like protien
VNILPDGRLEGETLEEFERKKELFKVSQMTPRQQSSEFEKLKTKLQDVTSWRTIVQEILKELPIHYDKATMWWMWNKQRQCYEIIDETDILNVVDNATRTNTLASGAKFQILEAFKREGRKIAPKEIPKSWVQFKNKIIDTNTGEEIEATPEYFLTNPIPHNIGENEETPIIDRLLEEWGKEYATTLKEIIAYCCLRDYPLHRIFLLIGSGSNGKGTYLRLLNNFIGNDNIASTEMDLLINNQFHITKLHKKLCCQMSETNFQALKNTSMLKRLSGGDLIGFEYKNKKPFDDYNYAKILIATNSLPITHDKTDGFYRRWVIVDFNTQFSEKTNPLINIPESEYEGLSRWVCKAIRRLQTNREFTKEGSIADRKERYEIRSNPLQPFIQSNFEQDLNGKIPASEFYAGFAAFLNSNGYRNLTYDIVRGMMKSEGYDYERHRLPLFDNAVACVVGLKRKEGVSAVSAVSPIYSPSYTWETNIEVPTQLTHLTQVINKTTESTDNKDLDNAKKFIRSHPKLNAVSLEAKFGKEQLDLWLNKGDLMRTDPESYYF